MPKPRSRKGEEGQESPYAQRKEEASENSLFPIRETGQDMRIGNNQVASLPESLHRIMQSHAGEMHMEGSDDLSRDEPEENDEAGTDRKGMPVRRLGGVNVVIWKRRPTHFSGILMLDRPEPVGKAQHGREGIPVDFIQPRSHRRTVNIVSVVHAGVSGPLLILHVQAE
jgi:hypothetical protein